MAGPDLCDARLSATTIWPGRSVGGEDAFDVGVEAGAVHRAVEHPGGDHAILGQARDEGLRVPMTERGMVDQALADGGPAGGLDEVGLQAGLINEHQSFQHVGHVRLARLNPHPAPLGDVGPQDLAGQQRFFYG